MEKVIEKIQKLLALSASSNEHEAALAAAHAQRLLALHNLRMSDIDTASPPDQADSIEVPAATTLPKWSGWLATSVASSCSCRVIHVKGARPHLVFIGVGQDVEVASYTYQVLEKTIRRLAKAYLQGRDDLDNPTVRERARRSYYLGAARAVGQTLVRQAKATPATTGALVVVKDQLIERKISEMGPLRTPQNRQSSIESDAYNAGHTDGYDISMNKGLKEKGRQNLRIK